MRAGEPPLDLLQAVQKTLELDPQVRLQEQVLIQAQGAAEAAAGPFDFTFESQLSETLDTLALDSASSAQLGGRWSATTDTTVARVGLSKLLPWGMTVGPSAQVVRSSTTGSAPYGRARVAFSVMQPLFRGRGRSATLAALDAARADEDAARLELRHTVARRVSASAQAFHAYGASFESVEILRQAESRAAQLLEQQRQLAQSGEHPVGDLRQVEANLADARARLAASERSLADARRTLGLAMGVDWRQVQALPPPASLDVPLPEPGQPTPEQTAKLVERALQLRGDRLAAKASMQAADALLAGARRSLDPQVDVQLDLGYAGLTEGGGVAPYFTPLADQVTGPNLMLSLTSRYPVENRGARGALLQAQAGRQRVAIALAELDRGIGVDVSTAARALGLDVLTLSHAEEAVAAFREAVSNEQKKLTAGLSTLIDVILLEGRLTSARLDAIDARLRVLQDLVELRYASGTLLGGPGPATSVGLEELTTLPAAP